MGRIVPPVKPYYPESDIEDAKADVQDIQQSRMLALGRYTSRFETEHARTSRAKVIAGISLVTTARDRD